MATKTYKREHGLTIEQLNAIELLVIGKTDKETAEAVGVNRVTITKWRLYDPYFQAELNRKRKEIWGSAVDKFRALLLKALNTIEKAIEEGDAKLAIEILRITGMDMAKGGNSLGTYLVGEPEAEKILEKLVEEKKRKEMLKAFPTPTDLEKKNILHELDELATRLEKLQARTGT